MGILPGDTSLGILAWGNCLMILALGILALWILVWGDCLRILALGILA